MSDIRAILGEVELDEAAAKERFLRNAPSAASEIGCPMKSNCGRFKTGLQSLINSFSLPLKKRCWELCPRAC